MSDKNNIRNRRAGILNLIAQHERGFLSPILYKTSATYLKLHQLPKFCEQPRVVDGFERKNWTFLRNSVGGYLIGMCDDSESENRFEGIAVTVYKFESSYKKSVSNTKPNYIVGIDSICTYFKDIEIADTADLYYRKENPLLIVGNRDKRCSLAIMTTFHCDKNYQEFRWGVNDSVFCCATQINSADFAVGVSNGFYVCKNFRLSKKYDFQGNIVAVDFNSDGNLLFLSNTETGIQCCDMRENITKSPRNTAKYIKEPVVNDLSFIAYRMKLLSDQITLIVSDNLGHISKIDLRMNRTVFQYAEHENLQYNRPLSIDEDLDLLCAVDKNSYCRVWSLSSGKLQWGSRIPHNIDTSGSYASHACIVSCKRRWFVATFDNNILSCIVPDEFPIVSAPV